MPRAWLVASVAPMATIQDVALDAGVSTATVS
ncbi:MAG: LacI family DNA-binding transcriptional regulator, partial [Caulobacter sp.]|nr:LacI family DNA-binding transcriptional regulator [Caulobacter sp.]